MTALSVSMVGHVLSRASSYADARAGAGNKYLTGDHEIGQEKWFYYDVYQAFYVFSFPADITGWDIDVSSLTYIGSAGGEREPVDVELRLFSWGPTLEVGDFVPGADLGSYPLLASEQ
jgi:hypothetical protein